MYIYHHLSALRHYYIEHSLSVNRNEQLIIPKTLVSPYENPTITSFLIISFANSLDFNQSANMQTSSTFAAGRRDHWAIVLNKDDTPMPDASPAQAPSLLTPSSIVPLELLVPPLPPFNEGQMRFCGHCRPLLEARAFYRAGLQNPNRFKLWEQCNRCQRVQHASTKARAAIKAAKVPTSHEPSKVHKATKKVVSPSPVARLAAVSLTSPANASPSAPFPWNVMSPESGPVASYAASPPLDNPFAGYSPVAATSPPSLHSFVHYPPVAATGGNVEFRSPVNTKVHNDSSPMVEVIDLCTPRPRSTTTQAHRAMWT
jgi:hypothetical protein